MKALSADQVEQDGRKLPRLGKRPDGEPWNPKVKAWWAEVWASPVSVNFDVSDHLTVWELADVRHRRLAATSNAEIVRMSSEERAISNILGLNPKARATQKVEVDRGEAAERRTRTRRNRAVVSATKDGKPDTQVSDPRDALTA